MKFPTHKDFVDFTKPLGETVFQETGIPGILAVVQSSHESNWGNSELSTDGNNYFGMTVSAAWRTEGRPIISFPSTEFHSLPPEKIHYWNRPGDIREKKPDGKGGSVLVVDIDFCKYTDALESFRDWGQHIKTVYPLAYKAALANDAYEFIVEIGHRYATDGSYVPKLLERLEEVGRMA